jgi:hypothetical protein
MLEAFGKGLRPKLTAENFTYPEPPSSQDDKSDCPSNCILAPNFPYVDSASVRGENTDLLAISATKSRRTITRTLSVTIGTGLLPSGSESANPETTLFRDSSIVADLFEVEFNLLEANDDTTFTNDSTTEIGAPCKYPLPAVSDTDNNADSHNSYDESSITSEGEYDDNKDELKLANTEADSSIDCWIEDTPPQRVPRNELRNCSVSAVYEQLSPA